MTCYNSEEIIDSITGHSFERLRHSCLKEHSLAATCRAAIAVLTAVLCYHCVKQRTGLSILDDPITITYDTKYGADVLTDDSPMAIDRLTGTCQDRMSLDVPEQSRFVKRIFSGCTII